MNTPHVILLHGLWLRGVTLLALKHRLEKAQFTVELFDYSTVLKSPQANATRLHEHLLASTAEQVHLVGHSLGGLIALNTTHSAVNLPPGRIVCLGSPFKGSAVMRFLSQWPTAWPLLGKNREFLCEGLPTWEGTREVGGIAGDIPVGLGMLTGTLMPPHDGTVSVDETKLPGLTDHCTVSATHLGLLFSEQAANQTIAFLQSGRFNHSI